MTTPINELDPKDVELFNLRQEVEQLRAQNEADRDNLTACRKRAAEQGNEVEHLQNEVEAWRLQWQKEHLRTLDLQGRNKHLWAAYNSAARENEQLRGEAERNAETAHLALDKVEELQKQLAETLLDWARDIQEREENDV